jgi:hypothetical protein
LVPYFLIIVFFGDVYEKPRYTAIVPVTQRLRREDHLSSETLDQPGQHNKIPSQIIIIRRRRRINKHQLK